METKVYFNKESETTLFDDEQIRDWKDLVTQLGLTEQEKLVKENKSVFPFRLMNEAEDAVYSLIFNVHEDYKNFSNEAIPLEVLSVIALCEKEQYFEKIEIWYSRSNPDPLVIGRKYPSENARLNGYTWNMTKHMIASWGDKVKNVKDLLPLYDTMKKEEINAHHEYQTREHEKNMRNFKLLSNAFKP